MDFIKRGSAEGLGDFFSEDPRKRNVHKRKNTDKVRILRRAAGKERIGCCNTSKINGR